MTMSHTRVRLSAVAVAGFICVGIAFAQTPSSPAPNSSPTTASPSTAAEPRTASSTVADVEKWTADEWDAVKAKWSKENAKWAACEQQATDQKLSGRTSWVFIYKCMF